MAKKAKSNIACDGKLYEQGKIYANEEVAHLDQSDFEDVADEATEVSAPEVGTFSEKKEQADGGTASLETETNPTGSDAQPIKEALE